MESFLLEDENTVLGLDFWESLYDLDALYAFGPGLSESNNFYYIEIVIQF